MNDLLKRMKSVGSIKTAEVLSKSSLFNTKDVIPTQLPILNVAFTGSLDGGLVPGLTILAGESKSFKTLLALYCMKAYLDKYSDGIALLYDSEFGITPDYLVANGIDTDRVLHIPIEHVEQLKFDVVKRLEEVKRGDKVFVMLDSLGNLASKKETDDAMEEKSVADMSRAKAIRSLFRIITPHLTLKDIPCLVINHVYQTMELYSKVVIPGGTAVTYSANQIFVITKAQEKDGTELVGWNFTINIHKSRSVKEKSKLPFQVTYTGGIKKFSGLLDIALRSGDVIKPSNGYYQLVDTDTGELVSNKVREKDTGTEEFLGVVLKRPKFKKWVEDNYKMTTSFMEHEEDLEEELE